MSQNFADPTATIDSLISKFTLCLITMAAAFLFYGISNKKSTTIPVTIAVRMAIILLSLSVAISVIATYEFYTIIPKYQNSTSDYLYSKNSLIFVSIFYCTFCALFVMTNIYICYLLIKYHK